MISSRQRRDSDRSSIERAAENSLLKLIHRWTSTIIFTVFIPASGYLFYSYADSLVSQLKANTTIIDTVSKQQAITTTILDDMVYRVRGLEDRERSQR